MGAIMIQSLRCIKLQNVGFWALVVIQWNFLEDTLFKRPPPLERPLDNVNLNMNISISTPDERPPLLKGHFSDAKEVASQEGFHCI